MLLSEGVHLGVSVVQLGLVLLIQVVQALTVCPLQLLHLRFVRQLCLGMLLDNTKKEWEEGVMVRCEICMVSICKET